MNATDIRQKIKEDADARFGDTVDKLLYLLRQQHTHQSHKGECFCEYCTFIRTKYTDSKIALHHAKRKFDYYDNYYSANHDGTVFLSHIHKLLIARQNIVFKMKAKKFDMWKDVL